jgi:hypothetical protein
MSLTKINPGTPISLITGLPISGTEDVLAFRRIGKSKIYNNEIEGNELTIIATNEVVESNESIWADLEQEHLKKQYEHHRCREIN